RRRHTRSTRDWSSDVCSSDLVAPKIRPEIEAAEVTVLPRPFEPSDLDGAWLVVAAATLEVNREVAAAAEERHVFVNAVDDPGARSEERRVGKECGARGSRDES